MVQVFREVRRVLKDDGVLWLNLGDSYCTIPHGPKEKNAPQSFEHNGSRGRGQGRTGSATDGGGHANRKKLPGLKHKDLVGIPWRVAFALQSDGWYLRSDIIWAKPNPMPESVTDRPTKAHEYIFLMSKGPRYYYNAKAIYEPFCDERMGNPGGGGNYVREAYKGIAGPNAQSGLATGIWEKGKDKGGRNKRTVWDIATQPYSGSHFATFPEEIPRLCILAGSRPGDTILDPFGGSGTTRKVALENGRKCVHLDISYHELAKERGMVTPAMAGLLA